MGKALNQQFDHDDSLEAESSEGNELHELNSPAPEVPPADFIRDRLSNLEAGPWAPDLDECENSRLFRFEGPLPKTGVLWDDLLHGKRGLWFRGLIAGLRAVNPGSTIRTAYQHHDGQILVQDGLDRDDFSSKRPRAKEAMAFLAQGLDIDPEDLAEGKFPEIIKTLAFLDDRETSETQVGIASSSNGRPWAAKVYIQGDRVVVEGHELTGDTSLGGTAILVDKLHWRLARDWRGAPGLSLDTNCRYPKASLVTPDFKKITGPTTGLEIEGKPVKLTTCHEIPVGDGTVECLNLDGYPKTFPHEWDPQRQTYNVGTPDWYIYIDGNRQYIGGGSNEGRRCLMDWHLNGFSEATDPDFRVQNTNNLQGIKGEGAKHLLAIKCAMHRMTDPSMIRLLLERLIRVERFRKEERITIIELEKLSPELESKIDPISPETAALIKEVWGKLFGDMRIARNREEVRALEEKYPENYSKNLKVWERYEPIPECFPGKEEVVREIGSLMAQRYLEEGVPLLSVLQVAPEVYDFLNKAGIPTVEQELAGELVLREETNLGTTGTPDDAPERKYIVIELPPDLPPETAEALADQTTLLTNGRVSSLSIPEEAADQLLFDDENPHTYLGDGSNISPPNFTSAFAGIRSASTRPMLGTPLVELPAPTIISPEGEEIEIIDPTTEFHAEDPTYEADEPSQETPDLKPYVRTGLKKGNTLDENYLLNNEGIDVQESHMPVGYYANKAGTNFSVSSSGISEWTSEEKWEAVEIPNQPPKEFDTRIVMTKLDGDHRLLIRPEDEIIGYAVEGGPVQFYRDLSTGLYRVEGQATKFTYWTAREENPTRHRKDTLDCEKDPIIELKSLTPETRAWIEPLLDPEANPVQRALMIQKAWSDHFIYDSRNVCLGNDEGDYVRNLLNNPTGQCAEAGEGLALLHRIAGNPSHIYDGYWHSSDGNIGSHRWGQANCAGQWLRFEGTEGTSTKFTSLTQQPMPTLKQATYLGGYLKEGLNLKTLAAELRLIKRQVGRLATRQNATRAAIAAAILAGATTIFGAGMLVESKCHILGGENSDTPTETTP